MAWVDSHQGAAQLKPNARLPWRHIRAHFSYKDGEKGHQIGPYFNPYMGHAKSRNIEATFLRKSQN